MAHTPSTNLSPATLEFEDGTGKWWSLGDLAKQLNNLLNPTF